MGLLNNPKSRERIVNILRNHGNKLCILFYAGGILWFLGLAYRPFNAKTYFSENALLPGLVDADFHHEHGASEFLSQIRNEIKNRQSLDTEDRKFSYEIPSEFFRAQFQNLGLEAFVQNYSFSYPAGILKNKVFSGQNVYGILRAPRASSTEALVLSVPYRPPQATEDRTTGAIALMFALAKAFSGHSYWAKDIIFLLTEHEEIGMQAWLNAYHDVHISTNIEAEELAGKSGSIQAALNLEIAADTIQRFNLKIEGVNGQLPNLDLVNTAVRLCNREGIPPTLHKRNNPNKPESQTGFQHSLGTMLTMMTEQAFSFSSANHGLFHRFQIEAITLQGYRLKNPGRRTAGFREIGRVVEGIFRSLNNLLERFHQSFFFYILPATDQYISIGLYMPPFGLLTIPVIIKAIALWLNSYNKEEEEKKNNVKENQEETDPASKELRSEETTGHGLLSVIPVLIMTAFFGLIAYNGPHYSIETGRPFHMPPGESLMWGVVALQVSSSLFPHILKRKAQKKGDNSGANPQMLKFVALLMLAAILAALSLMNISLAFFLAVVWVPTILVVRPTKSRILNLLQSMLLQLVSPFALVFFVAALPHLHLLQSGTPLLELLQKVINTAQTSALTCVIDAHIYGHWMHTLITTVLFPTWLLFWALLWTNPELY